MDAISYEVKDGGLEIGLDKDLDGIKSLKAVIHMSEAIKEAFKKGQMVEGMAKVKYGFEGTNFKISVDTDQDGKDSVSLEANMIEGLNEAGLMS